MSTQVLPYMGTDWIEGYTDQYIIISLSHSTRESAMFWRADEQDYTSTLIDAGKFPGEQVRANLDRYNNGLGTVALRFIRMALGILRLYPVAFDYSVLDAFLTIKKIV